MQHLGYYESKIISEYITDDIGIDIEKIGGKNFEKNIPIDLQNIYFISSNQLSSEISEIIHFLKSKQAEYRQTDYYSRLLWFRINIIDQAFNEYLGIGYLNIEEGWLDFIIYSLSIDRADQSGDGIFTIIDKDFNWAVNFELSQDNSFLTIQKVEK
jgi:hypothetical protein